MKEFKNIVNQYQKIDFQRRKAALATVVKVRGSSYRSPGARMLITDDGRWVGSISGGCLEGDALRKARQVMLSGEPRLVTYDTTEEGNSMGIGLGCNGVIDVLIEPIDENATSNPVTRLRQFIGSETMSVMATVFKADGQKNVSLAEQLWLDHQGDLQGQLRDHELQECIEKDLVKVMNSRKPAVKSYRDDCIEVFMEIIEPVIDLLVFGGGFDARPVVDLAKTMGWDVTVIDECIAHVAPVNFPSADKVMFCKREQVTEEVRIKPYSAAVLMSHSYEYDLHVLKRILSSGLNYIGILGPAKRSAKMFEELENEGIKLDTGLRSVIHSPVGLDIGAETPEEIALSVISEIQAKFTNRSGGFLKYRKAPIHQRDGKDDQVFRQVFINRKDQMAGSA